MHVMCVLCHALPIPSLCVPSSPEQLTELFILPWVAALPKLPLTLLDPLRHAPLPSNVDPVEKRLNLDRVRLRLFHLMGPIQPLRLPTQSNQFSPSLHLFHPSPTMLPKDRHPFLVDQILRLFRAL